MLVAQLRKKNSDDQIRLISSYFPKSNTLFFLFLKFLDHLLLHGCADRHIFKKLH